MGRSNGAGVFAGIVPKNIRDQITKSVIDGISQKPVKTPDERKRKRDTIARLEDSLGRRSTAGPAKRRVRQTPAGGAQQQRTSGTVQGRSPSFAQQELQQEQSTRIVQNKSPNLAQQNQNAFSLFGSADGTSPADTQAAAQTAVADIRSDVTSPIARTIYQSAQGTPSAQQGRDSGAFTRASTQSAAAERESRNRAALIARMLFAPSLAGEENVLNTKRAADYVDSDKHPALHKVAQASDTLDRLSGRAVSGAISGTEDFFGAVSAYGNKALALGAGAVGLKGAQKALNDSAEHVVRDGLFGNIGKKYGDVLTEKHGEQTGLSAFADQVAQGVGYMAPSIVAGAAAAPAAAAEGGAALANSGRFANVLSRLSGGNAGLAMMSAQSAQSSANEAINDGADLNQALTFGAAAGMLSAATERIAGGIPGLPEGVVTEAIANRFKNQAVRRAVSYSLDVLGEGAEEALESYLTPYIKRATYDPDAANATAEELAQSALLGVVTAAVLRTPADLANLHRARAETDAHADQAQDGQERTEARQEGAARSSEELSSRQEKDALSRSTEQESGLSDAVQSVQQSGQERTEARLANSRTDSTVDSKPEPASLTRSGEAQQTLAERISHMSESELYQAVKNGDILFDDLIEILEARQDAQTRQQGTQGAQEGVQTPVEEYSPARETSAEEQAAARETGISGEKQEMQQSRQQSGPQLFTQDAQTRQQGTQGAQEGVQTPVEEYSPARETSAEEQAAARELGISNDILAPMQEVREILEARRASIPSEAYQAALEDIADYEMKARTDGDSLAQLQQVVSGIRQGGEIHGAFDRLNVKRPLRAAMDMRRMERVSDYSQMAGQFQAAFSTAESRAGTVLDRLTDTEYRDLSQTLREIGERAADPESFASQADEYENLEISADVLHPENVDTDTLVEIRNLEWRAKERRNNVIRNNRMTESDIRLAQQAARNGSLSYIWSQFNHVAPSDWRAVALLYEAESDLRRITRPLSRYNAERETQLQQLASQNCAGIDRAADMRGIRFSMGTPLRNLQRVFGKTNPQGAQAMYDTYFGSATHHEAERTRHKRELLQTADSWRRMTRQEQQLAGMLADNFSAFAFEGGQLTVAHPEEFSDRPGTLDSVTQETVKRTIQFFNENSKKINLDKAVTAATQWREMVGENGIYGQVAAALARNGYEVPGHIADYYPHFHEQVGRVTGVLRRLGLCKAETVNFGFDATPEGSDIAPTQGDELPTSIAGRTEEFRGRHAWSGNIQSRGRVSTTDYNIVTAFEHYIDPMLDIIHFTDDVSALRTLEDQVRFESSSVEVQERFQEIMRDPDIDPITKRQRIETLFNDVQGFGTTVSSVENLKKKILPPNNLSGFVTWLRRYTDNLAGKKSVDDRAMEYYMGRDSYRHVSGIFSRISRNMTTSISSTMTNVIPVIGSIGDAGPQHVLGAVYDTAQSMLHNDGFEDMSDFLANRRGTGPDLSAGRMERAANLLGVIDRVSSQIVTRAYYRQALGQGKTHTEALDQANRRAGELMADRSKTQLPLIFQSKNPAFRLLTTFQVEVNNDLQHLVHDLPERAKTDGAARVTAGVVGSAACYFLFNNLFEAAFGYRPFGLDFIDWIRQAFDLDKEDDDEKDSALDNAKELGTNVLQGLPFVGTFAGGGRVPLSSALPGGSISGTISSAQRVLSNETTADQRRNELINQWSRPAATLLPPAFGNQIRKTALGLYTMQQGGSYTTDYDGNRVLQAPVNQSSPAQWIQAAVAGKSALPAMRDYYDKGLRPLSAEQTQLYDRVKNRELQFVDADTLYKLMREYNATQDDVDDDGNKIDGTREYKMRMKIAALDLSENDKVNLDLHLLGQKMNKKERTGIYDVSGDDAATANYLASTYKNIDNARAAVRSGLSWSQVASVLKAVDGLEAVTEKNPYTKNENSDAYYFSEKQNKMLAIMDMDELNEQEKHRAAWYLVDGKAMDYDFSSPTNLVASMVLTDRQREAFQAGGYSAASQEDILQAALRTNWDWQSYRKVWGGLTDKDAKGFKHYSLYGMENLSPDQKKEIGKVLFDDPDNIRYDDRNTITACMVSTSCGNKWAMAHHFGFSIDEYTAAWKAAGSGEKKAEKITAIVKQTGMDAGRANTFVSKVYFARANKALLYSIDAETGEVVYSGSGSGGSSSRYWSFGFRKRHGRGRVRRSGRRSHGGGGGGGSGGSSGATTWSNAAFNGYGGDSFGKAYNAASMFSDPSQAAKNVMNVTGWSWTRAHSFVRMLKGGST